MGGDPARVMYPSPPDAMAVCQRLRRGSTRAIFVGAGAILLRLARPSPTPQAGPGSSCLVNPYHRATGRGPTRHLEVTRIVGTELRYRRTTWPSHVWRRAHLPTVQPCGHWSRHPRTQSFVPSIEPHGLAFVYRSHNPRRGIPRLHRGTAVSLSANPLETSRPERQPTGTARSRRIQNHLIPPLLQHLPCAKVRQPDRSRGPLALRRPQIEERVLRSTSATPTREPRTHGSRSPCSRRDLRSRARRCPQNGLRDGHGYQSQRSFRRSPEIWMWNVGRSAS